jgi:two-component system LytT family response regulator
VSRLRVVVADDEPIALALLASAVEAQPDLELVARCGDGLDAFEAIRRERPDLAFLDIRMPEMDGFEVVDALDPRDRPRVVFVTAYDEHALGAFQRHALAYLLKPFEDEDFREVMAHVRPLLGTAARGEADRLRALVEEMLSRSSPPRHLVVRSGTRTRVIPVQAVDWLEADGNYTRIHCGDETHLVTEPMGTLAERLVPAGFARIHRSAAVNLERVREFRTQDHRDYTVILDTGAHLRLSRTYRQQVEARLGDRI